MSKKTVVWGTVFGVIAPLVGLFLGLQVAPILGNILLLPILGLSSLFSTPIGMFSAFQKVLALIVSIIFWVISFSVIEKAVQYFKGSGNNS